MTRGIQAGIFVGGRGRRMGGAAKGLLDAGGGETILARWRRLFADLGVAPVLVGAHEAYASSGLEIVADDPSAEGPLAGLLALLAHAERSGAAAVIAVACDMPRVSPALLRRLAEARSETAAPDAPIVAARRDGRWEPFFARYDAARVLPVARARAARGELALQGLLDACGAAPLALTDSEAAELCDWDTSEDVAGSGH